MLESQLKEITIYTDGACEPNPGPGGYGAVLIYGERRKEISGGFRETTNNRMEILAAIKALEVLKEPCKATLFSDSKYLVESMAEGRVAHWKANDWHQTKKKRAVNTDLWDQLLVLCDTHEVEFKWVRGHAGVPENERADRLSYAALERPNLPADEIYEQLSESLGSRSSEPRLTRSKKVKSNVKVDKEGHPCRNCGEPVVKRAPKRKRKQGQKYYYEYILYCPGCKHIYLVEDAKREIDDSETLF